MDTDINTNLSASAPTDRQTDYTLFDDIKDIASALLDLLLWIARASPTNLIARLSGRHFDPEGCPLPEWDYNAEQAAVREILDVQEVDGVEETIGGFKIGYNGEFVYSASKSKAEVKAEKEVAKPGEVKITEREWEELKNYDPPLLNIPLARKVKNYLLQDMNDREISILTGYKPATVKHYRLALQKAAKQTT